MRNLYRSCKLRFPPRALLRSHCVRASQCKHKKLEQEIIKYFRDKYNPEAILLHGSRAVGKERPHSDWDIIMMFDNEIPRKGFRENIGSEDVEWKAYLFPNMKESVIEVFGTYLQFAKVLWEKNMRANDLLRRAQVEYAEGPNLKVEEIEREKLFMQHKLLGMKDDVNTPDMFLRHLSVFFNRSSNLWFEVLHNQFPKPFYLAIPEIEEQDPDYFNQLDILSSNADNGLKIKAAEDILKKLFKSN